MDSVHKCPFTAHAACFLTRHFMSHAKVITLKIILRRPFLQWAKAPQLSDSLTETRMCPHICIVSTGLLTAVGAGGCMLICSESLNQRCLFLPGDPTLCPSALDTRWGRKQSWHAMKRDSRPVFIRDGAKEPDCGVVGTILGIPKLSMASVPPCYYCYLRVPGQTRNHRNTCY